MKKCRIIIFFILIGVIGVGGLLFFLRPTHSALEKRDLAAFPELTIEGIVDGSYFSSLSTWYADTFPLREYLIAGYSNIKRLYGMGSEEIYGDTTVTAEEIPEEVTVATTIETEELIELVETEELTDGEGTITAPPEVIGSTYVADGRGFELFYFSQENMDTYASVLNTIRTILPPEVTIYDIAVPNSTGVYMDEGVQESLGTSNQGDAISYLYAALDPSIVDVDIYDLERNHNGEYLYFNTDHHWTARGAYYAYQKFCEMKGIEAHPLESFETVVFDNFLGSFYASSGQSQSLYDHMDFVEAFYPYGTNLELIFETSGSTFTWEVIHDVSDYAQNLKYSCFIGGDYPMIIIENPQITDGSACLLIKESYGNAFAPFLVDHYQYVYIADYRYNAGGLPQYIAEHGITDVIFMNGLTAITKGRAAMILNLFL